jgi:hypothetical protein
MSGITKYKLTLYNEAVIDTTTNTVVFEDSPKWKDWEDWKINNQMIFHNMVQEKQNKIVWNSGYPIIKDNKEMTYTKDGILASTKVKSDGGYIYCEFHTNGDLKLQSKVEDGELVYEKEYHISSPEPFRKIVIDEFGTKIESIYHEKDILRKRVITIPTLESKVTSYFDEEGKLFKKIQRTNKVKRTSTYFIPNKKVEGVHGNIESQLELNLSSKISNFTEWFPNRKIRTSGIYNEFGRMEGKWKWYSRHGKEGQVESIHNFLNGKLVGVSQLFMEDGGLFFKTEI